ncbi:MAG: glucose 1-dehydrogenase [Steroidobacteraceae bacterium]|nr:glucose 1-dehydrogenase [Steroidobacteraceae bacterium]
MARLTGKVAIVTGAARGMGAAIARRFVEEGATVALTDILPDVETTAQAIGPSATAYRHDVTNEARWREIVDEVIARHGRVDVLVNNAGILMFKDLSTTTADDFRRVFEVNAVGTFIGMRTVAPHMIGRRSGSIVNNSSCDGISPANSLIAYASSKFAVRGMTKVAALELGPHGVRVNSVHPGSINTPMVNPQGAPTEAINRGMSWFPAQRVAEPVEAANCFVFLASDDSSFCMGTELIVDGGLIAGHYYYGLPGAPEGVLPPSRKAPQA